MHENGRVVGELPTGTGKTDVGLTYLRALRTFMDREGLNGYLFYITHTKTQVEQIHRDFAPDFAAAYGRGEHECIYPAYVERDLHYRANEIPCAFLKDCPSFVDQDTGGTRTRLSGTSIEEQWTSGVPRCPYYQQKYEAKRAQNVVCTYAFYLFTVLFSKEFPVPFALVIDEAQRIAQAIRLCLSYEISDYHVFRSADLLERVDAEAADQLREFGKRMVAICRRKPPEPTLLRDSEIRELMGLLVRLDQESLRDRVGIAVSTRIIDAIEEPEEVRKLEMLIRDLVRYYRSMEYSLPSEQHQPLNYTYAAHRLELTVTQRRQHWVTIKSYYVAPLIRKLLPRLTIAYSATLGRDPEIFQWETGIDAPFYELPSDFPPEHTRIFMPTDTPNLSMKTRPRREPTRILRKIAQTCRLFGERGIRSLVVVVSNAEREKFLLLCKEEQTDVLSYGNGQAAKDVATRFKNGEGVALVGTFANYGEGIDLPRQIAPVIFSLRPGYPRPDDPATLFELRRFGQGRRDDRTGRSRGSGRLWALWNWRVTIEFLQVRGRNIRSAEDMGVCFFISQQWRRVIGQALPSWLWAAYRDELTFEQGIQETLRLFSKT